MTATPTTPGVERIRTKAAELGWTVAPVHPTLSPDALRITRGAVAVFVYLDRAGQITEAARHEHGDPVANVNRGAKLRAVLAWLDAEPIAEKVCAQCGSPKSSPRHTTNPNRAGHPFVEQLPDLLGACDQLTAEEIAQHGWRTSGAEQIAASIEAARAEVTEPAAWGEEAGPVPGSFHDPAAECCQRDAADCNCPPQRCERCRSRFTEDDAGADPAAGLCPSCSASNADRVTL